MWSDFSLLFIPLISVSILLIILPSFDYHRYITSLKIRQTDSSHLFSFFFFRIIFTFLVPLPLHVNFRILLLNLQKKKKSCWNFDRNSIQLYINLESWTSLVCWVFQSRNREYVTIYFYLLSSVLCSFQHSGPVGIYFQIYMLSISLFFEQL